MAKAKISKTRTATRKKAPGRTSRTTAARAKAPRRRKGADAAAVSTAAPVPATSPPVAASPTAAPAGAYRAKVRMYRQGLGDCFLISLKRSKDETDYKILIDCGVILGTADPGTIMTKVVNDIVATTGGKVDLLLATHEHWDHLSGFIQAAESFAKLSVGEVWLAWTEDPDDALAKQLGEERRSALTALQMCNSALRMANDHASGLGPPAQADIVAEMLGFFGGA